MFEKNIKHITPDVASEQQKTIDTCIFIPEALGGQHIEEAAGEAGGSKGNSYLVMQTHVSSLLQQNAQQQSLNDEREPRHVATWKCLFHLLIRFFFSVSIDQCVKMLLWLLLLWGAGGRKSGYRG